MIRDCQESDLVELEKIDNVVFKSKYQFDYEFKENPYANIKVLELNDEIIGYYDVWIIFERCEIARIAVKKEYQHQGYGQLLMNDLEKLSIENGCENIQLEVRVNNTKAINLYEKNGFITLYTREKYYGDEDGIVMMKGI